MKKPALLGLFIFSTTLIMAQAGNDRRGYQGTVTSALTRTVIHDGGKTTNEDNKTTTALQFSARSIVIGDETYDIVKKEFDGKSTTTFTCTKRRGTFDVTYKVGDSITVVDEDNPDEETVYLTLAEK